LLPDERVRTSILGPGHVEWARELSQGAFIARVASEGPARNAGLRKGDVVLSVDGVRVDRGHSLNMLIQDKRIGEMVTLSARSALEPMYKAPEQLKVTLGSAADKKPWLGVRYRSSFFSASPAPWSTFPRLGSLLRDLGVLHAPATAA